MLRPTKRIAREFPEFLPQAMRVVELFELQSRESELAVSRVSELNAMIDYNTSLILFEMVQKIQ